MKYKTNKLRKIENERYSILTQDIEHCFICKMTPVDLHEIYGGCNRVQSMKNGFCIPLCRLHHRLITDGKLNDFKAYCQEVYERTHTRKEFLEIIGRNYL